MGKDALDHLLALWGSGLATVLAALKIYETWSSRRRLVVSSFLSEGEGEHRLYLTNLSSRPVLLRTWAVVSTRRLLFWRFAKPGWLYVSGRTGEAETIPPHGQLLITISPNWAMEWKTGPALKFPPCLELYIADRHRPLLVPIVSAEQRRGALRSLKRRGAQAPQ